ARLCQPFSQADPSMARTRGGLGLGLALVRGLVESHGGAVDARSAGKGKGAEFLIRLPLRADTRSAPPPASAPPAEARDPRPLRILLVEDNIDSVESLQRLLQIAGHTVEVALDGASGIETARRFQPEVVICDIGLRGERDG